MASRIGAALVAAAILGGVCRVVEAEQGATRAQGIEGPWEVTEVISPATAKGGAPKTSEPGVLIFSHGYYSAVFVASPRPRVSAADLTTPEDFRAVWGGAFTAQAGRYSVEGADTLLIQPIAAKNPTNMGQGAAVRWKFELKQEELMVTEPTGRVIRLRRAG